MPVIFISYRRSDSQDVTGRIYDRLVGKFTQKQILKDVDNIPLGVSFPMHLQQMIGKANVVLVIIGPGWVTATDERGNRRLDDPADFVRVEVEASLRANIPVIPVLVSNAPMPKASELPKSMQKLAERNGMAVRPDPDFNNDIGRLFSGIEHLERLLRNPTGISAKTKKDAITTVTPIPTVLPVEDAIVVEVVRDSAALPRRQKEAGTKQKRRGDSVRRESSRRSIGWIWVAAAAVTLFLLITGATYWMLNGRLGWAMPASEGDDVLGPGGKYALLIGIDTYDDPQILPRKHAEADAKLLYDILVDPQYVGIHPRDVRLLLGSPDAKRKSQSATKDNVLKAIRWIKEKAGKDDLVVLVWVGQGAPLGQRTCYYTKDSSFRDRAKDAVGAADLKAELDEIKSHRFAALVDVNFKGTPVTGSDADLDFAQMYREFLGNYNEANLPQGRLFLAPGNGFAPPLSLADNGAFAKVVADGLRGQADASGYEPDSVVTVAELIAHVRKMAPDLARAKGRNEEEMQQEPILWNYVDDFALAHNPALTALVAKRLDALEKIARDGSLSREMADEGAALLKRMPELEARQNLRKLYQKLADGAIAANEFTGQRTSIIDGMKLPRADADEFARVVRIAASKTMASYFKDLTEPPLLDSAIRGMYERLREPIPLNIKTQLDGLPNLQKPDLSALLAESRIHLGKREDLAGSKDVTLAIQSMLAKLDFRTFYVSPEQVEATRKQPASHITGVGVQVRRNVAKNRLVVVTPLKDGPAYKAGVLADDIIMAIIRDVDGDGKALPELEVTPTTGMSVDEAVKKITGKEGTKVTLRIERDGNPAPLEFTLTRGAIKQETVIGNSRNTDDSWDHYIDLVNKIAYVRLTELRQGTASDLDILLRDLRNRGIKGFVLDLRFNGGGLLSEAIAIADLFVDDGQIVTIRPRNRLADSRIGKKEGSNVDFPMVCLVNGQTASGCEIVAGCLQDHGRAVIIGSRTYGLGSIQTYYDLAETGGLLHLTTATFWRPSGRNLNKSSTAGRDDEDWGVRPDSGFEIRLPSKEVSDLQTSLLNRLTIYRPERRPKGVDLFRDAQLERAVGYLNGQLRATLK